MGILLLAHVVSKDGGTWGKKLRKKSLTYWLLEKCGTWTHHEKQKSLSSCGIDNINEEQ